MNIDRAGDRTSSLLFSSAERGHFSMPATNAYTENTISECHLHDKNGTI